MRPGRNAVFETAYWHPMKFFFCEKCGERLTEHDIDGGDAKNKKLRGVFCKDCSVGVMTMETAPLTDTSAREIVEAASLRTESRGSHYRSDHPQRDDANWLTNIFVTRNGDRPELERKWVAADEGWEDRAGDIRIQPWG